MAGSTVNPASYLDDANANLLTQLRRGFTDTHDRVTRNEKVVEELQSGQTKSTAALVSQVTAQFANLFRDASDAVVAIQTGSFTSSLSTVPASLVVGPVSLTLAPTGQLPFVPSPIVLIGRTSTLADYAVARLVGYDPATRALDAEILIVAGDPGPHDDLYVTIGALAQLAQADGLIEVRAARLQTADDREAAEQAAATSTAERKTVSGLRLAASEDARRAKESADAAATFDPANFATTGVLAGEVAARMQADVVLAEGIDTKADADATSARLAALEDDVAGAYTYALAFGG